MKKIINGHMYNTDTATVIGVRDNGYQPRDCNYVHETLYRKTTGAYFMHGVGGANSIYGVRTADGYDPGEQIIALSQDEAMAWAEEHLDADTYISAFGPVPE